MRGLARWLAAASWLGLAGCTTLQSPSEGVHDPARTAAFEQRRAILGTTQGFQALGRVAVKGGGLSGALSWQQQGDWFSLRLAGPFGTGATLIEGTPGEVHLKNKDVDLVTTEPELTLAQQTGWQLPLAALRWWVLGLPAPGRPSALSLDAQGRPEQLEQDGWALRYPRYAGDDFNALPSRIEASRGDWMAVLTLQQLTVQP